MTARIRYAGPGEGRHQTQANALIITKLRQIAIQFCYIVLLRCNSNDAQPLSSIFFFNLARFGENLHRIFAAIDNILVDHNFANAVKRR